VTLEEEPADPEARAGAGPEAEAGTDPEAGAEAGPEAEAGTDSDSDLEAEPDPDPYAQALAAVHAHGDPVPVPDAGFSPDFMAELTSEAPPEDVSGPPTTAVGETPSEPSDELRVEDALLEEQQPRPAADEDDTQPGVPADGPGISSTGWQPRVIRPERVGGTDP
jgi:hypothetical protein